MSALTRGEPLSLAHLPVDRVVRVAGITDEQLAVSLDPLPDRAPVVIRYRVDHSAGLQHEVVDDVLATLESAALKLYPAWLPDADDITTSSDFDVRVVRELAHRHAAATAHFGPFLADLAEAAHRGGAPGRSLGPEIRASGLTRIIADAYRRNGVVLLVGLPATLFSADEQRRMAVALEWLANQGVGTWLTAGVLPLVDRYPTWQLTVPEYVDALSPDVPAEQSRQLGYPPLAGMPHPASAAEQRLESALARTEWAAGRTWNQQYVGHSLAPPIRVDLMWPAERCAVEIDGPDHRGSLKYAADRRRDNGLTLDGFAVLRFTNEEILDDHRQVLAVIESLLSTKRHDEGNLT